MITPQSFIGNWFVYPGKDIAIITNIVFAPGYSENIEHYSIYTRNKEGEEKWVINLPINVFVENNGMFLSCIECPICYENFQKKEVYTTSCNHTFCKKCMIQLCKQNITYTCPVCRNRCYELSNVLNNCTVYELYKIYYDAVSSEESRQLQITQDLDAIIGYILTSKDKRILNYLLEESNDVEFKNLYKECIIEGKKYFILIQNPIEQFALALLHTKYH